MTAKSQALKTARQSELFQAFIEVLANLPSVKLWRLRGRVKCFKLELKPSINLWRLVGKITQFRFPNVRLSRLLGKITSQALIETAAQIQTTQTARKGNFFHILIEPVAKCQALKTAGQGHSFQALAKSIAKCQMLKAAWKGHSFQALVEMIAKFQTLKTAWQVQPLILQLNEPNVKLWRLFGKLTPSRLSLKSWWNVKLSRLWRRWCKYVVVVMPASCVTPSRSNSAGSAEPCFRIEHQAACRSVGT